MNAKYGIEAFRAALDEDRRAAEAAHAEAAYQASARAAAAQGNAAPIRRRPAGVTDAPIPVPFVPTSLRSR
eukprot:8262263-Pyramimonas_sp.AAC.1